MLAPRDAGSKPKPKPKPKPKAKKKSYAVGPQGLPTATGKVRSPKPPSPRKVALAQEKTYASQGRSIHKQAKELRKQAYTRQPLPARRKAVKQAAARVRAGTADDYDRAAVGVHKARQRSDARQIRARGRLDRVVRRSALAQERYYSSYGHIDPQERERMALAAAYRKGGHEQAALRVLNDKTPFKQAGVIDKVLTGIPKYSLGPITSAAALPEALATHPLKTASHTLKSVPSTVAGIPSALAGTVLHPAKTAGAILDSQGTPYSEKVDRIVKHGALEDLGNAALMLGPSSTSLARFARSKGVTRAARLKSGGVEKTPEVKSAVKLVAGKALDARRARSYERKAAQGKPLTALEHEALKRNRAAGQVVAVVPARSKKQIKTTVAKARGKAVHKMHREMTSGDFGRMSRATARLNKKEQRALYFAAEVGVRTPEAAVRELPKLRAKMVETRGEYVPKGHERDMDVIAQIDEVLKDPAKHFTPKLNATLDKITPMVEGIAAREPQYSMATKEGRRRATQRYLLDVEPGEKPKLTAKEVAAIQKGEAELPPLKYEPETPEQLNARTDAAAAARGLAKPLYFKSEKQRGGQVDYAAFSPGGLKAKATTRPFAGKNLGQGIFDTSRTQFLRGYANNVKALHNYEVVDELTRKSNLGTLTPEPQGVTVGEALNRINRAEPVLDKSSVGLINPGLFQKHMDVDDVSDYATLEDAMSAAAEDGMKNAVLTPKQFEAKKAAAAAGDEEAILLTKSPGWHAVPMESLKELEAEMRVGTPYGRVADIVKGTLTKGILMTGNLPWLAIQMVSESGVTAAATRGRVLSPANWAGTVKWWKGMSDEQRANVAAAAGMNATAADAKVARMGSAVQGGFVDWFRALKSAELWHKPRGGERGPSIAQLSPMQLMVAADRGKTNVTRLLAAHDVIKRETVADVVMGMKAHEKAATKLMAVFKDPVDKQIEYLSAHPEVLEDVADTLNDYLGDWTTMTAAERKVVNRAVMFYPFVRYSTRLVFWTMPVNHPAVSALLGELGELKADEYRDIFGDDNLPWMIGKVYFGKTGDSMGVDLRRAHPAMNALMDIAGDPGNASKAVGIAPPYFQWAADQLLHRSSFSDREWITRGKMPDYGMRGGDYDLETRGRILLNDALSLMYPVRELQKRTQSGFQGDDALPFSPRPVEFKSKDDISLAKAKESKTNEAFLEDQEGVGSLVLGPLYPVPSRDATRAKAQAKIKDAESKRDAEAAKRKKYRLTHGGKNPPKPKSPFGSRGKKSPFQSRAGSSPFRSG